MRTALEQAVLAADLLAEALGVVIAGAEENDCEWLDEEARDSGRSALLFYQQARAEIVRGSV